MKTTSDVWQSQFQISLSPEEIRRRARVTVKPLHNLDQVSAAEAEQKIREALQDTFVPTAQVCSIIEVLLGIALAHAKAIYQDRLLYMQGIYAENAPLPESVRAICFTGPAGVGKSALLAALRRVLSEKRMMLLDANHPQMALEMLWEAHVGRQRSIPKLLSQLGGRQKPMEGKGLQDILNAKRKEIFKHGVCFVPADEFQFVTQSSNANTLVTQILLAYCNLGVPFAYTANYSLVHRLFKRNQEDRQRLLANPIFLLPDPPHSQDWIDVLTAYRDVAPEVFQFDPKNDAIQIYRWTNGIKRMVTDLLALAYRHARAVKSKVSKADLEWAFHSAEYTTNREEVALMQEQDITGRINREKKRDLWCPFELPKSKQVVFAEEAIKAREEAIAKSMLESSLTANERSGLSALQKDNFGKAKQEKAKVLKMNRAKKPTAEELIKNSSRIAEEYLDR